jgi:uncharacterized coiled-coil DUF342 family protein
MATQLDHISEAIGALRAEVAGLRRDLTESTRRADSHRAAIHKRVDEIAHEFGDVKAEIAELTANVAAMGEDVKDSKTVTDEVKQWKQRGVGALFVAGIAGTALGGIAVGFIAYWWDAIMKVLRSA